MDIKTYRAKTMRDALELVRRELGPSAAVLHTREVNSGPLRRLVFGRKYEVAASAAVNVPSRLPEPFAEPAVEYSFHSPVAAHDSGVAPAGGGCGFLGPGFGGLLRAGVRAVGWGRWPGEESGVH